MKRRGAIELILAVLIGSAIGLGAYTFLYAKGYSYLVNDPAACANCHVMNQQYDGWIKGSHRNAATCNDCHTPHNFAGKYMTKAVNGFFHSLAFTQGGFLDPIQIKDRNRKVTETACRSCHGDIVQAIESAGAGELSCIRCHANVGHM